MYKLFLISQDVNNHYDTYDSAVVCATSKKKAQAMFPFEETLHHTHIGYYRGEEWAPIEDVKVKFIGTTNEYKPGDVVIASFNAG